MRAFLKILVLVQLWHVGERELHLIGTTQEKDVAKEESGLNRKSCRIRNMTLQDTLAPPMGKGNSRGPPDYHSPSISHGAQLHVVYDGRLDQHCGIEVKTERVLDDAKLRSFASLLDIEAKECLRPDLRVHCSSLQSRDWKNDDTGIMTFTHTYCSSMRRVHTSSLMAVMAPRKKLSTSAGGRTRFRRVPPTCI